MKLFVIGLALLVSAYGEGPTVEYLPPGAASAPQVVETNFLEGEPAHSLSDDGYRYKTVRRVRLRHRRDVNELSSDYLPPQAAPAVSYQSAPEESYASEPAVQSYEGSYAEPEPAHTLSNDGYRYKTVKRYRLRRHRRDVNELSSDYLPPQAAPAVSYQSAPEESYASEPAVQSYEGSYAEPEPAHTLSNDGYRYKTVKRYRLRRHRRDVNELSSDYLPPQGASAPAPVYSSPSVSVAPAEAASSVSYAAEPEQSYDISASEPAPAHTLSNDGYRYKTVKRFRYRHRH